MVWYRNPLFILLMIMGIITLIVVIANIGILSISSGKEFTSTMSILVGLWWLFLSLGFLLLLLAIFLTSRIVARIGLFLIFLGIFEVELIYILPIFGGYLDIFKGDFVLVECSNVDTTQYLKFISCLFGGHAIESKNLWIGWTIWFVFVFMLPLAILYSLFYEFSDFLTNKNVRNVVTFAMSLIAYRALMSTIFIEILTYGAGGIALLFINWLFFAYILKAVDKMFELAEKSERLSRIFIEGARRRRYFYDAAARANYWNDLRLAIQNRNRALFQQIRDDLVAEADLVLTLEDKLKLIRQLSDIEKLMMSDKQEDREEALRRLENLEKWLKPYREIRL